MPYGYWDARDLRERWGDKLALQAANIIDDIDRTTGLARLDHWLPIAFDPSIPPIPEMESSRRKGTSSRGPQ